MITSLIPVHSPFALPTMFRKALITAAVVKAFFSPTRLLDDLIWYLLVSIMFAVSFRQIHICVKNIYSHLPKKHYDFVDSVIKTIISVENQ